MHKNEVGLQNLTEVGWGNEIGLRVIFWWVDHLKHHIKQDARGRSSPLRLVRIQTL